MTQSKRLKITSVVLLILLNNLAFIQCNKRTMPPESVLPATPTGLKLFSGNKSITTIWENTNETELIGHYLYFGTESRIYSDTLFIDFPKNRIAISGLEENQRYYFCLCAIDKNDKHSFLSEEQSASTYYSYENFSSPATVLDSSKWHYNVGFVPQVIDSMVSPDEFFHNGAPMTRSFGQYLKTLPQENFFVECQFKLGTPNVGGAGIIIRSQKANPEKYYQGYYAYLFWNSDHWNLHVEESLLDRYALRNIKHVPLPEINSDEWIKLSVKYIHDKISIQAIRLSDMVVLGTLSVNENQRSRRPRRSDNYCGFFTTQYGRNTILVDNFGIGNLTGQNLPVLVD